MKMDIWKLEDDPSPGFEWLRYLEKVPKIFS